MKSITFEHEFCFAIDAGTRFVTGISSRGATLQELWDNSKISGETMHGGECMTGWSAGSVASNAFLNLVETLFTAALKEAEGVK